MLQRFLPFTLITVMDSPLQAPVHGEESRLLDAKPAMTPD